MQYQTEYEGSTPSFIEHALKIDQVTVFMLVQAAVIFFLAKETSISSMTRAHTTRTRMTKPASRWDIIHTGLSTIF